MTSSNDSRRLVRSGLFPIRLCLINKLPCNHFSKKINKRFFSLNRETKIQLIIESLILDDFTQPYDIYFEIDENINIMDNLIKKEIIEFLSLLN